MKLRRRRSKDRHPNYTLLYYFHAPLGIVQLYCACSETASPWVSFTSYLPTLSFQANEVGPTDTKPCTGHFSSRKKFSPTWGVPGIAKRGSGSAHLTEWWESVEFSSYVCLIDQIMTSQCFNTDIQFRRDTRNTFPLTSS